MIEEFSFGNFWSFKEVQSLNMTAAKIKSRTKALDKTNIISLGDDNNLIKSKAIYGANSSGKSNIVRALAAFCTVIRESNNHGLMGALFIPFRLASEMENKPSYFQLIFRIGNTRYRYGFEIDQDSIKNEWLLSTPKLREQILFIRNRDEILKINKIHFKEGLTYQNLLKGSDSHIFTPSSLFLTHLSRVGFAEQSKQILKFISSIFIVNGLSDLRITNYALNALNDNKKKKFLLDFLNKADTGIQQLDAMEIEENSGSLAGIFANKDESGNRKIIISSRTKYDENQSPMGKVDFAFTLQESEGTKKMFDLSPFVYQALKDGTPLIIDEFDARLHPLLTKKIIELFHTSKNKQAQLIFVTHDVNLLSPEILRRDQIDFVEKDKYGASHLYTLTEIKGVRNDASYEKDYIQGKYGAIPFLGDFDSLINID